jgi:hypothetical protein
MYYTRMIVDLVERELAGETEVFGEILPQCPVPWPRIESFVPL